MYPDKWSYQYCTTEADVRYACLQLTRFVRRVPILAVDTETTGFRAKEEKLRLISISTPEECFVFPIENTEDALTLGFYGISQLLIAKDITKILQNGPFDYSFLFHHLNIPVWPIYDTQKMAKQLSWEKRSLKSMAKLVCNVDIDKGLATSYKEGGPYSEEQLHYSALDAGILWPIFTKQITEKITSNFAATGLLTETDIHAMVRYVLLDDTYPEYVR